MMTLLNRQWVPLLVPLTHLLPQFLQVRPVLISKPPESIPYFEFPLFPLFLGPSSLRVYSCLFTKVWLQATPHAIHPECQWDSHHPSISACHFPLQSIQYFHSKVFNPLTFIIKYRFIAHCNTPREACLTTFLHGPSVPIKWMYSFYAMKHLTVLHFCNFDYVASTLVKISFLIFSHSEISGSFMAQFKSFLFMKDHPYKAHADWTFIFLLENPLPLHLDCGSRKGSDTISSFLSEPNIVLDQDLWVKTLTWNLR